jgi:hypothetical protein
MEAIVLPRRWEDFGEADGIFRAPRSDKGERMIFNDNFRSSVTARWSTNGRLAITRNAAGLQLSLINGQLLQREPMQSKPDKPNTASFSGHRKAAKNSAQITEKSPLTPLGSVFSLHYLVRLPGCKVFLAGRSNFFSRRCVGAVEVLDALGSDTKLFCPPETANNLDRVRLIVAYIEARPEPMKNGFRLLARMKPWQKLSLGKIDIAQEFLPISGLERLAPNNVYKVRTIH